MKLPLKIHYNQHLGIVHPQFHDQLLQHLQFQILLLKQVQEKQIENRVFDIMILIQVIVFDFYLVQHFAD